MELLIKYLSAGIIEKDPRKPAVCINIYTISEIINCIIPFFEKYPLLSIKQLNYLD